MCDDTPTCPCPRCESTRLEAEALDEFPSSMIAPTEEERYQAAQEELRRWASESRWLYLLERNRCEHPDRLLEDWTFVEGGWYARCHACGETVRL